MEAKNAVYDARINLAARNWRAQHGYAREDGSHDIELEIFALAQANPNNIKLPQIEDIPEPFALRPYRHRNPSPNVIIIVSTMPSSPV